MSEAEKVGHEYPSLFRKNLREPFPLDTAPNVEPMDQEKGACRIIPVPCCLHVQEVLADLKEFARCAGPRVSGLQTVDLSMDRPHPVAEGKEDEKGEEEDPPPEPLLPAPLTV
jgi:hypothetical protein